MKEIIKRLENMLGWSDRLGRDEVDELKDIIKKLKENK